MIRWARYRQYLLRGVLCLYVLLIFCALFNFKSRVVYDSLYEMYSDPVFTHNSDKTRCQLNISTLGLVNLNMFESTTFEQIESENREVEPGGRWAPPLCSDWQRVAVIIPYRERLEHLKLLLRRLHPMLRRQMIDYRVFVIEQTSPSQFNRGRLLNIGVLESLKVDRFDCFVFQDVDLLPEHDLNIYHCNSQVLHLASAIDEMRYHVLYYNYAGGVVAINKENIYRVNGHSNDYWGWGNEDDDFSARTEALGLKLTRPPEHIGRYKMIRHEKQWRANSGNSLFLSWRSRWKTDGLNSINPTQFGLTSETLPLYTLIKVDLGPAPTQVPNTDNLAQESLLWFLWYYFP